MAEGTKGIRAANAVLVLLILAIATGGAWAQGFPPARALNTNADTDTGEDEWVRMATDDAGNWVAVWHSDDDLEGTIGTDADVLVATSSDDGKTWSAPAALNTNAATDTGDDARPDIATDGAGTWLAVWHSSEDLGGIGGDQDILFAVSTDNGATWSASVPVNTNADADTGSDSDVRLATDGQGHWVAVWVSYEDLGGIGTDPDILVAMSSDAGASWTASAVLNSQAATDGAALDYAPRIATDGSGNWVVVWDSNNDAVGGGNQSGFDIMVSRSTDNGASWTPMAVLNSNAFVNAGTDTYCGVACDGAGNWIAVWQSNNSFGTPNYDIIMSRSTDHGATWSAAALLNTNGGSDTGYDGMPCVATDKNGLWRCVWQSDENLGGALGGDWDILTACSWDIGASWTTPTALTVNASTDVGSDEWPALACDDEGNWVAAWHSDDDLLGVGTDYDIFGTTFLIDVMPPSDPGATAIGLDTITWTWQDNSVGETGFKVYDDPGAGPPTTLQTTTGADVESWQHNGLSPNTQYGFQVAATDGVFDSAKTPNYTTWTLIEPVAGLTLSDLTTDSITVATTNTPSNLAQGSSGLLLANTTVATDSGWQQTDAPWVSSGLDPNIHYTFEGTSRNGEGIATTPASASRYTLAETPITPAVTTPTAHTLTVYIFSMDGNPASVNSAKVKAPARVSATSAAQYADSMSEI